MNIWRTLRDRLLRFTTHRKLAMAGDSTSASSEPASKDRVPLKVCSSYNRAHTLLPAMHLHFYGAAHCSQPRHDYVLL